MDMPSSCSKCDFCEHQDEGWLWCNRRNKTARAFDKPDWCPLRELPQKKEADVYTTAYDKAAMIGYNACIDELLKGVWNIEKVK